ncbi:hypothetical protein J2S14_001368 [Lederbergia wuyishanensis]|uniref:Uncharacterized protein n=1 Tax=Lederbergia wuyishanensis TaxID=1347903 RepID=A0ABU0D2C8_9BACI|nr:hypothetical protein [Lederbergia wuyishanensis]
MKWGKIRDICHGRFGSLLKKGSAPNVQRRGNLFFLTRIKIDEDQV